MINSKANEVTADDYEDRQAQINDTLMDLHTAMPAIIISYNHENRTVKAQPAIKRVFSDGFGVVGAINLPPCIDVPVVFPSGGGYELTFPVKAGDECLLVFAERCIDGWYSSGDTSPPMDYRHHDLSDAFAIVGVKSLANKKPAKTDGVRLGSDNNRVDIEDEAVTIQSGEARLTLTNESLNCNVDIICPNVITDRMSLNDHIHTGVDVGTANTSEGY